MNLNPNKMIDGRYAWEEWIDYYFEFRWWKYAIVFGLGWLLGYNTI